MADGLNKQYCPECRGLIKDNTRFSCGVDKCFQCERVLFHFNIQGKLKSKLCCVWCQNKSLFDYEEESSSEDNLE